MLAASFYRPAVPPLLFTSGLLQGEVMKLTYYTVKCNNCGGDIRIYHDKYRSETDAKGKERYYHLPVCPSKEADKPLGYAIG